MYECMYVCMYVCMCICVYAYVYPLTPADGKRERVMEERLWTKRNTTTDLGKLSKVAEQQQHQGATAASINTIGEVLGDPRCFACVRQSKFSSSSSSKSSGSPAAAALLQEFQKQR